MIPNNNLSVLPFYSDLGKQNHRKDYAFGEIYNLITPDRKVLPFQIIREHRVNAISSAVLKRANGVTFLNILTQMVATGLGVNEYSANGYDVIIYPGVLPMSITTPEGLYYLELSDGVETWYSEVFNIVRTVSGYMKISYWDKESLQFSNGLIDFTNAFKFTMYLPTQVGQPEYTFEEQLEERDGYQFIEKQISEKTYRFVFVAPEYLLDAMRIIRMMDYVQITSRGEVYEVDRFLITPEWQDGGYLASVTAEFQCDTVIKKLGKGYEPIDLGSFNNDFNDDFDNQ